MLLQLLVESGERRVLMLHNRCRNRCRFRSSFLSTEGTEGTEIEIIM